MPGAERRLNWIISKSPYGDLNSVSSNIIESKTELISSLLGLRGNTRAKGNQEESK